MNKKSRFCANCGKETDTLIDNICRTCYSEMEEIKIPKRIIQRICPKCKAIFSQGLWINSTKSIEASLNDKLKRKLVMPESEELKELDVDLKNSKVKIKTSILGKEFNLEGKIKVEMIKRMCKECRAMQNKKHTVKIQLRLKASSSKSRAKIISIIKEHSKAIQKIKEYRNGVDIYLRNPGVANTIAKRLNREFNCRMSKTSELYSWDRMKDRPRTRHTILLRQI